MNDLLDRRPAHKRSVVILSSVKWGFTWQRHQALARAAMQAGWNVVYVEPRLRSLAQIVPRLTVRRVGGADTSRALEGVKLVKFSPRVATTSGMARQVHKFAGKNPDLVIAYVPSRTTVKIADLLRPRKLIYDEVLDWSKVPRHWYPPTDWAKVQDEFYRRSATGQCVLVTDSPGVREKWREAGFDGAVIFPATDDEFIQAAWPETPERGPIGYFGSVDERLDLDRIVQISRTLEVRLVGPSRPETKELLARQGVSVLPPRELGDLVEEIATWSAIMMPYLPSGRGASFMPAKIWNCLATGLPIFASGLELPTEFAEHLRPFEDICETGSLAASEEERPQAPSWRDRWMQLMDTVA